MPVADREEPPVLRVEALAKQFDGLRAVDGVSFDVARGEIVGIIGPNGAGKTVLINLISGFYPATSGSVHLAGEDVTSLPLHEIGRRGIARTFQNIRLFGALSVLDNVLIGFNRSLTHGFLGTVLRTPRHTREDSRREDEAMDLLRTFNLAQRHDLPARSL
ncbi:MAG: ATP-binding cassette domain-containing protein, partial [Phycisphaerae bacterium]|nr:ATP-binding cassette domain-containing protein [Phycisphaerae bacterium]